MKTITVHVTADDIRFGIQGHCSLCPVARALHRATGELWEAGLCFLYNMTTDKSYRTPLEVRTWISQFDEYNPCLSSSVLPEPFTFTLEIDD